MSTPAQSFAPVAEVSAVRRTHSPSPHLTRSHPLGVSVSTVSTKHDWAVILAAADGTRLAALTRDINGVVLAALCIQQIDARSRDESQRCSHAALRMVGSWRAGSCSEDDTAARAYGTEAISRAGGAYRVSLGAAQYDGPTGACPNRDDTANHQ